MNNASTDSKAFEAWFAAEYDNGTGEDGLKALLWEAWQAASRCGPEGDMESMRVTLGCCLALMLQSGNPGCEEMARRIPFTMKNGQPYALVGECSSATDSDEPVLFDANDTKGKVHD